jgi:hypothetical protein
VFMVRTPHALPCPPCCGSGGAMAGLLDYNDSNYS